MTEKETLAVGHTERKNASGVEVSPKIKSNTSVGMTGGHPATKEESQSFTCGSVKNSIRTVVCNVMEGFLLGCFFRYT